VTAEMVVPVPSLPLTGEQPARCPGPQAVVPGLSAQRPHLLAFWIRKTEGSCFRLKKQEDPSLHN